MNHCYSVFANSCLKVPVDPITKMPKTAYERKEKTRIDSTSSASSVSVVDLDADKLKDFYRSIPDYNEINHLSKDDFYSTLKSLREKKRIMLGLPVEHLHDSSSNQMNTVIERKENKHSRICYLTGKSDKPQIIRTLSSELPLEKSSIKKPENSVLSTNTKKGQSRKLTSVNINDDQIGFTDRDLKHTKDTSNNLTNKDLLKTDRQKRNYSACSISWNDTAATECKNDIDKKFEQFFHHNDSDPLNEEFKTQSMPSSPLRRKRILSPAKRRKSITIPKPFKMTERDEEERVIHELHSLRKSFSEDMLNQKHAKRKFKAKPVPIESRIPLYEKILEDQAMRRAITKINSEAELRAQMKPFSFTKKEEKGLNGICERATNVLPKPKKKKRFKARPVPKNLFSNYFYDKMKEEEFFRSMNKRIRAEELLRTSSVPGTMSMRDRSRLSTPAAHSDLPIDSSPVVPSTTSSEKQTVRSSVYEKNKRNNILKENFITTSPQPFRFNTADRAAKKIAEITKKNYQENKSIECNEGCDIPRSRAYSALDLKNAASGRSNLAALLRAEAVRRKFELEAARRLVEQRRRSEMKQRDRLLRSKPAWHLVKNNHEEDLAMRLQTRRDEERMRREEFLHEMELMYGRVQEQPLLFERFYAPRSNFMPVDTIQLSPRKTKKRNSKTNQSYHCNTPNLSRKASINNTDNPYKGDLMEYLNEINNEDKSYSDSEVAIEDSSDGK